MASEKDWLIGQIATEYQFGFSSEIATDLLEQGLNEEIIQKISKAKKEPDWLLAFRLDAYRYWQTQEEPTWSQLQYTPIDYQKQHYYATPKKKEINSLSELDPAIKETFDKLGIPLMEQERLAGVATDVVLDSVSLTTTWKAELEKKGILFCGFSEAVVRYPDLVRQYLGKVVPYRDNYFASLNSAVFTDGSFCYIPQGVRCPMELSTYFRINAAQTGQFERTLLIAEEDSYVSYLEGCTAPMRPTHQLHAAVVEIYAKARAEVRYATIQNWYPGDAQGKGGIYNFVTKRGICAGEKSKIRWAQVEVGAACTWKYPSCILKGEGSIGEFYSVAITKGKQQADTGTKMIHIGSNSKSRIIAKSISAQEGQNSYRGLVKVVPQAKGVRNFSQCDSLLIGNRCGAHTFPTLDVAEEDAIIEHEATTSKVNEEVLFYCQQRGINEEEATALIITGHCKEILQKLPMEFAHEAEKLLGLTLEGSVG